MQKMIEHVDELAQSYFKLETTADGKEAQQYDPERKHKLEMLQESGIRIKERLHDLVDEYDEHTRACTTIMDGLNLATNLVSSYPGHF